MLANANITTIVPVRDIARARGFYESALGLDPVGEQPDGGFGFGTAGGSAISLLPDPDGQPSPRTTLSFEVDDVSAAVHALEAGGVAFEDYDIPGMTTVGHISTAQGEQAAWFKDTEGNILCVHGTQ